MLIDRRQEKEKLKHVNVGDRRTDSLKHVSVEDRKKEILTC